MRSLLNFKRLIIGLLAILAANHALAQTVRHGAHGSRLVEWDFIGLLSSLATPTGSDVIVAGNVAVSHGGQLTFRPALWNISAAGNVTETPLPVIPGGFPPNLGFVNDISRNGSYLVGHSTDLMWGLPFGTLWRTSNLNALSIIGQAPGAVASLGTSVADNGTTVGVAFDGIGGFIGFSQDFGGPAILDEYVGNPTDFNVFTPTKSSADGSVVVGDAFIADSSPQGGARRAAYKHNGEYYLPFQGDLYSSGTSVSPNGRFVGIYGQFLENGSQVGRGIINDLQFETHTPLQDSAGNPWNALIRDISDDGRLAVGNAGTLSHPEGVPDHGAFIAIDGVARSLDAWLAEEFSFSGLSLDMAPTVYMHGDAYHFAAQSTIDNKAYYISIPVASVFSNNGDLDGDNDVDGADFLLWQRHGVSPEGLARWKAGFGQTVGAVPTVNVPEMPALNLALFAFSCFVSASRLMNRSKSRLSSSGSTDVASRK